MTIGKYTWRLVINILISKQLHHKIEIYPKSEIGYIYLHLQYLIDVWKKATELQNRITLAKGIARQKC